MNTRHFRDRLDAAIHWLEYQALGRTVLLPLILIVVVCAALVIVSGGRGLTAFVPLFLAAWAAFAFFVVALCLLVALRNYLVAKDQRFSFPRRILIASLPLGIAFLFGSGLVGCFLGLIALLRS